ncbi:hypothetical protein GOP47_0026109 [Adiantum capillus-veneris]|uniref:glutathione transferase n=1 Tax=Adiantum capillus-veneris TaxID=13818 RepID=A0A9D4U2K3_ADICA|nr:hypothetical protein GOP47_0025673 [Adiantum capillus-veneris]KAI5059790.1 hypothetical protein GOP47_0026109 [Adiantum capillus-veneris]
MPSSDQVQVLNTWLSMFGLRVVIALKAKGVHYEYLEQDLQNKSQLLLESNPIHKKIPVLIHNGKPVCESLIILKYIDEAWPSADASFLPKDPYDRAVTLFWADYIDKKMYDAGSRIIRSPDAEQRDQGKKDFIEVLETLDGALGDVFGGGPFFGGQSIGFVDIALAPFLCWFEVYEALGEFKVWEAAKCPLLSKWAEAVWEVPCVKEALSIAPPHKLVEFVQAMRKKMQAGS